MGHGLVQVILPSLSGLPEDVFVNTFHFLDNGSTFDAADAAIAFGRLEDFYNDVHAPGTLPIADMLSDNIDRANCLMKAYDMDQASPRPPIATTSWVLAAGGTGSEFPNEVCICLSYNSTLGPGDDPRTHRGRIYIGPLSNTGSANVAGEVVPQATVLNRVAGAGDFLATPAQLQWAVYSRKEDALRAITHGHVDNAYDIQRRRGKAASARTLWTA